MCVVELDAQPIDPACEPDGEEEEQQRCAETESDQAGESGRQHHGGGDQRDGIKCLLHSSSVPCSACWRPNRGLRHSKANTRRAAKLALASCSFSGAAEGGQVPAGQATTSFSLLSKTLSTRASSCPRFRIMPLAAITAKAPCLRASFGVFTIWKSGVSLVRRKTENTAR